METTTPATLPPVKQQNTTETTKRSLEADLKSLTTKLDKYEDIYISGNYKDEAFMKESIAYYREQVLAARTALRDYVNTLKGSL